MGTDIHGPFVEVNLRPGQAWQCVGDLDWQRDYEAFTLMAGVRAEGQDTQPLFEPRGNPADMSVRYEFHADEGGCHSASWLTDAELQRVQEAYPNEPSFQINLALKFMAAVAEEGHDLLQRSRDYWEKQHLVREDGSIDGGRPPNNFGSQQEIVVRMPEVRLVFCFDN